MMFYVNAKLQKEFGKKVAEGTVLFHEGEPGSTMFVIHRGRVKISKIVEGVSQTLVVLGDGQFFGEMAILNGEARSATATVVKNSEILEIPKAGFELLMQKSPEMAISLIRTFSTRLADMNKMISVLFYQDDYSRVLMQLKNIAEKKVAEGNQLVRISIDPGVLSTQINIGSSRIQKVVAELERAGVIVKESEGYKVENPREFKYFLRYIHDRLRSGKKAA